VARSARYAFNAALTALQTFATAKDGAGTMQAVNDLSAAIVDMYATYNPTTPVDIGRLDVLERQVVLDGQAGNYEAATLTLMETNTVWNRVKPMVLEHSGADVAKEFETSLQLQTEAVTSAKGEALTTEASRGLEIVDALEGVF
jgi:hypothetical protein